MCLLKVVASLVFIKLVAELGPHITPHFGLGIPMPLHVYHILNVNGLWPAGDAHLLGEILGAQGHSYA